MPFPPGLPPSQGGDLDVAGATERSDTPRRHDHRGERAAGRFPALAARSHRGSERGPPRTGAARAGRSRPRRPPRPRGPRRRCRRVRAGSPRSRRCGTARAARPADGPAGRIPAWAEALRAWSPTNPQGFRLIYGDPVPGYRPPEGGPAADAERRACAGLTGLVAAAWPAADRPAAGFAWSDFDADLAGHAREEFPGLPPDAVALALRTWGRMHGLLTLRPPGPAHRRPGAALPGGDARPGPLAGARGPRGGGGLSGAGRAARPGAGFPGTLGVSADQRGDDRTEGAVGG
ncbi:TetR-like C-terminal domain-containing protein [Nocardiopsis composta]|uniref:TetR-like C-terminal domain-containing protein n=1 Tax=Nocardiopsis composta TaxID=157465 RepID=UPI0028AC91AA|nr:TetR-like C-terminal domain-containing protein [Nocardiopsis composta]